MTTTMTTTETKPNEMPVRGTPQSGPNVKALISAFQSCSPWSRSGWNRIRTNEDVRFNTGAGHTPDCRKKGTKENPAFPWNNASNQKSFLADGLIGEITDFLVLAFWRAWMTPKAGSSTVNNYAVKLLDYIVNTWLTDQLETEVELSAQYLYGYGWVPIHPCWEFEVALEYKTVTLDDLTAVAGALAQQLQSAQGPGSKVQGPIPDALVGMLNLPALIHEPELENYAMEALDYTWQAYGVQQLGRSDVTLPPLSPETLREAVRDLRAKGTAEVPVPYVCKDQPGIRVLKPWEEFLIPGTAADVDRVPAFHVCWLSEVDLLAKQLTENWDPGWVQEALKFKGKFSAWSLATTINRSPDSSLASSMASAPMDAVYEPSTTPSELVEVVYATYRLLDKNNVPGIYLTIFHPQVGKVEGVTSKASSYAWHGLLKDARGHSPYVIGKREHVARTITSSRGVPEIVASYQDMTKIQMDGAVDWTSIGVLPPINEYATAIKTNYKYGPATRNTVQQGKEPKFMEVPGNGMPVAFEMLDRIEMWIDHYIGRKNPKLDPTTADARMQKKVTSFLLLWTRALLRCVDQCQARMEDGRFAEITGAPPGWLNANRQQPGVLSARLECDIRELNPEYVATMLETINEAVIPQDVNGRIKRGTWTELQMQMINPRLARSVIQEDGDASDQMYERVKSDVALMFVGQEVKYADNDPSAKAKRDFTKQTLLANPKYMAAIKGDERFRGLLEKYVTSLQFSITQRENATVGRIGVQPEQMENA